MKATIKAIFATAVVLSLAILAFIVWAGVTTYRRARGETDTTGEG
jgi:hypothetical protein